ncbi:MAG TPA: Ku protein [Solirubrobacteraceae bacterium]|jgi:DNA end-binding protein Ku
MPRSIWNGAVSFAGVDVPVKVFGATDPQGVQFRELHEPDGAEIAHQLVDDDGKEVDREQVVKGFEVRSGEYVVLDDDELKAAAATKRKTLDVEHFVEREQIDPDVYDRPYYLAPQDGAEEAYAVLAAALKRTGRVGIGRVVLRSREQLAAVMEADGMLRMHTMRFAAELVDASKLDAPTVSRKPEPRMRKMAAQLVDGLTTKFKPGKYRDTYRDRVLALVKRKAKGEEIDTAAAAAPEPSDDLMAALEASLKGAKR